MTTTTSVSITSSYRIDYARVSSVGHNLDSQMYVLRQAGCGKIFSEKMTGSRMDRPAWDQVLEYVRPGDTIVVTEPGRMTRSLPDLLETVKMLEQRRVNLLSLGENIDTTTGIPGGKTERIAVHLEGAKRTANPRVMIIVPA